MKPQLAPRWLPYERSPSPGIPYYKWLTSNPQADDELENPVLAGFEWDKDESWTRLVVHCKKEGAPPPTKKNKKKAKEETGDV